MDRGSMRLLRPTSERAVEPKAKIQNKYSLTIGLVVKELVAHCGSASKEVELGRALQSGLTCLFFDATSERMRFAASFSNC